MADSNLSRALAVVLIPDCWSLVPDGSQPPVRDGVRSSPFRKDHSPSFSIFAGLRSWKDQTTGEGGGVWKFVQSCRPEWSKQEVAKYLVERAGLEWAAAAVPPPGSPRRKSASAMARERTERNHAARADFYAKRNAPPPRPDALVAWPSFVRDHFFDHPVEDAKVERLAAKRGWPVAWVDALVGLGVLRFPELPWTRKRFPAFTVGLPGTEPVGYHQRIWTPGDGPSWLFVPYSPRKASNDFCRRLATHDGPRVPSLPFTLGDPAAASLWVVLEGQWDAVSLWGALGGFDDQFDAPVAVFGLRGAKAGPDVFLSHFQDFLRRNRPRVLLVPDNDPAGASWDGSDWTPADGIRPRTFVDRLIALTRHRGIPVWEIPRTAGKDFNDLWRADPPDRAALFEMIAADFPGWPG